MRDDVGKNIHARRPSNLEEFKRFAKEAERARSCQQMLQRLAENYIKHPAKKKKRYMGANNYDPGNVFCFVQAFHFCVQNKIICIKNKLIKSKTCCCSKTVTFLSTGH